MIQIKYLTTVYHVHDTAGNAFGILRARFRVFQGPLQVQPYMADKIVLATCCLHNFLMSLNTYEDDQSFNSTEITNNITNIALCNIPPLSRNPTQEAVYIGEKYNNYFMSPEGQVPWQMIVYGEIYYVIDKLINKHMVYVMLLLFPPKQHLKRGENQVDKISK